MCLIVNNAKVNLKVVKVLAKLTTVKAGFKKKCSFYKP